MIKLKNVSKSYDGVRNAVDDLTLDIQEGEIFGFLGPNGAGKTTTLKLITGLLSLDQGSISVNGFDIEEMPIEAKRSFSFVPDNPDIFVRLKGIEYLRFIGDIYQVGQEEREARVQELTRRFGIDLALNQMIKTYSHGMKQKLILTGALLHDPEAWLLDEPMTGLDPASSFQLKQLMRQHADEGKTVILVTHDEEVTEMADRVYQLSHCELQLLKQTEEEPLVTEKKTPEAISADHIDRHLFFASRKRDWRCVHRCSSPLGYWRRCPLWICGTSAKR